jgi:hypothetical protein
MYNKIRGFSIVEKALWGVEKVFRARYNNSIILPAETPSGNRGALRRCQHHRAHCALILDTLKDSDWRKQ